MPMGPPQGQPQPPDAGQGQAQGGASELVANIHTDLLKLHDLVGAKFPDEAKGLEGIIASYQSFIDGLGQAPGAQPQGPATPATTTPEAGAAQVQQAM